MEGAGAAARVPAVTSARDTFVRVWKSVRGMPENPGLYLVALYAVHTSLDAWYNRRFTSMPDGVDDMAGVAIKAVEIARGSRLDGSLRAALAMALLGACA